MTGGVCLCVEDSERESLCVCVCGTERERIGRREGDRESAAKGVWFSGVAGTLDETT